MLIGVVMDRDTGVKFFELFYNLEMFPDNPPPIESQEYLYVPISRMLATDESKTGIKWTRISTRENPTPRIRRQTWEYVVDTSSYNEGNDISSGCSSSSDDEYAKRRTTRSSVAVPKCCN